MCDLHHQPAGYQNVPDGHRLPTLQVQTGRQGLLSGECRALLGHPDEGFRAYVGMATFSPQRRVDGVQQCRPRKWLFEESYAALQHFALRDQFTCVA